MNWKSKLLWQRENWSEINWYLVSGVVFFVFVISFLAYGAWKLHQLVNDAGALPIESVIVKGERQFTTNAAIHTAMQSLMGSSFFSADVNQVQQALEGLPWVYRASVRREWPAKMLVFIEEQQPVAHWNSDQWINVHGELFKASKPVEFAYLPQLKGPEGTAKQVLKNYKKLSQLLEINGFKLTQLSLNPRHAWRAVLGNGIMLELGREDKMARIQRFVDVYPVLAKSSKKVMSVDLRYDTGLAVGWANAE